MRFWNSNTGKEIGERLCDHDGPIRSISSYCVNNYDGFLTSSNDGTVKVRVLQYIVQDTGGCGVLCSTMHTVFHPSQLDDDTHSYPFILDCCSITHTNDINQPAFASAGEDGSVLVWKGNGALYQVLQHPASVWCVLGLWNNDDFATAGHDGYLRIFSRRTDISNGLHALFLQEVEEYQAKKRTGPSQQEVDQAPHYGKADEQVAVFKRVGDQGSLVLIAAQWSAVSQAWVEIGVVTGGGDGGVLNGVTFDHVMPVEMDTANGVATLKLGYNNGENPFVAAKRFIDSNGLDNIYLQQIADWII